MFYGAMGCLTAQANTDVGKKFEFLEKLERSRGEKKLIRKLFKSDSCQEEELTGNSLLLLNSHRVSSPFPITISNKAGCEKAISGMSSLFSLVELFRVPFL